jgi:hypothetical protein
VQLRVYTKETRFSVLVQAGYRALMHDVAVRALETPMLVSASASRAASPSPAFSVPEQGEPLTPPPRRSVHKATSFKAVGKTGDTSPLYNPYFTIRPERTVSPSRGHARAGSAADREPPVLALPARIDGEDEDPPALFPRKRRRTDQEPVGDIFGPAGGPAKKA